VGLSKGLLLAAVACLPLLAPGAIPSRAARAEPNLAAKPNLDWLAGRWRGAIVGSPTQKRELTFSKTATGLHGVLDERTPAGKVTTIGRYDILSKGAELLLQAREGGQPCRLKGTTEGQSLRFLGRSSAEGLILFELGMFRDKLRVRRAFGPQHGATVDDLSELARVADAR
jgi:hypothetical protein